MSKRPVIAFGIAFMATVGAAVVIAQAGSNSPAQITGTVSFTWVPLAAEVAAIPDPEGVGLWKVRFEIPGQGASCEARWQGRRKGMEASPAHGLEGTEVHAFPRGEAGGSCWSSQNDDAQDLAALIADEAGTHDIVIPKSVAERAVRIARLRRTLDEEEVAFRQEVLDQLQPLRLISAIAHGKTPK